MISITKKRIGIAVISITFTACSQAGTGKGETKGADSVKSSIQIKSAEKFAAPQGWKTLNLDFYSIQYPPDWELDQSGKMNSTFVIFSPVESDSDKFRENVNLIVQDLSGKNLDLTLDQYTEISLAQIKSMLINGKVVESTKLKNDKQEYSKLLYTGDQQDLHLEFEQYYWIISGKAYVLTFTAEQAKYETYRQTAENILNSFILKK